MIPKKINYVWLGGGKKSNLTNMCILSWKDKMPDYEIIEWNEKNLDLDEICAKNKFFAECRKRKLWAFMADYLRLKILYENGGIYFDTDIEARKTFDDLLNQEYIIGMETQNEVSSAVIACEKGNPIIKQMLQFYEEEIWNSDLYIITHIMTLIIQRNKGIKLYPKESFSPIDYEGEFNEELLKENTYTIHWFNASWSKNKNVYTFLQTKHEKNAFKKLFLIIKKNLGFYYRKYIKRGK